MPGGSTSWSRSAFPKLVDTAGGELRIGDQPSLIFHLDDVTADSVSGFLKNYRSSLPQERRVLFDRFTLCDVAIKVVGVGSLGTRVRVHNGRRVVTGQHLMHPASDIFLGWSTSPNGRDFYARQLRDMKLSVPLTGDEEWTDSEHIGPAPSCLPP
jgi:Uncharacterized protein conserved in bacteria (DUF2252)